MDEPCRVEIWKMFDRISPTYDLINRMMTFGCDQSWRKRLVEYLPCRENIELLDCATGTSDQILSLMKHSDRITKAIGVDLAEAMLEIGRKKIEKSKYASKIVLQNASVLGLPFADHSFDCVTISFGIRNLTDVSLGLKEMHRVLKTQGRILVLEGSLPANRFLQSCHLFYLRHILPFLGGLISKNREAYIYLNKTIESFPCGEAFCKLLTDSSFQNVKAYPFLWGSVTLYVGDKL